MWKRLSFICSCILLLFFSSENLYAQLHADFSASNTSGCSPITVNFTNQSVGATSWQWDLGNGTISNLKEPSATYIAPGTYTVKLTATNGNNSDVITKANFITVYASPTVAFNAGTTTGCYPLTVPFFDQSIAGSGNIVSWQWDFGDGNVSNEQNPTHVYQSSGQFNVILTVKNSDGCTKTLTKQNLISISDALIANFTDYGSSVCSVPTLVTFLNYSAGNGITGYFWDFGDGQTSTEVSPMHIYSSQGFYTVSLTVKNANGCTNTIIEQNVVNAGIVKADFNMPATQCAGVKFTIQNASLPSNGLQHTYWDFGDGTTDTLPNPVKRYNNPGTYTVTLKSDYGACSDIKTKTITILKAAPTFTASITASCTPPLVATFTNTSGDETVVLWDFGDGTTSKLTNPSHSYTAVGDYTVKLTATNPNGCTGTTIAPAFIHIGPPNITKINGPPYHGCIPYNANFSANVEPAGMAVSYHWDFGDGTTSTDANPSHIYTVEGSYSVKLIVNAINGGCSDTISMDNAVVVGLKPNADFTANPLVVCAGENVYFTNQSTGGSDEYIWSFGDKTSSPFKDPVHGYIDTGYNTVKLIAIRNGCADTLTKVDYVYVKPPIAPITDSFLCSAQYHHYFTSAAPVNSNLAYNWDFGDGTTSTLADPEHVYADTGRYNVSLSVNSAGCNVANLVVYIIKENADFNVTDSVLCGSMFKKFSAAANSPYRISYAWNFGDGSTAFDSINSYVSHNYAAKGIYNVTLSILDSNKCATVLTKPVSIYKYGPQADFSVPANFCRNSVVNFTDLSKSTTNKIVDWIWTFGDTSAIQTFTSPPFTHIYKQNDTYDVQLVVVDAAGCEDTVSKEDVLIIKGPTAFAYIRDSIFCLDTQVFFYNFSSGDSLRSYWDFGDGMLLDPEWAVNHIYTIPGSYNVALFVTDKSGCSDTSRIPFPIQAYNATANFSMNDSVSNCPPLLVVMTNKSINAAKVAWDFGDGNTSDILNPSHTYTLPGTFNVKLVVTGNGGCTDSLVRKVVIAGPVGSFIYNPILGCTPLNVHFVNNTFNAAFYTWDFDDGNAVRNTNTTENHTYARLGTYLPKIILEDSVGCKVPIYGIDSIQVKGVEAHVQQLSNYLICDSGLVAFKDSAVTNDVVKSYLWTFGDGQTSTQENPIHKYAVSGVYIVNYVITTAAGCIDADTLKVPIKVVPAPNITFVSPASFCVPGSIQFSGQWLNPDTSILRWKWDFSNGNTSNVQNPTSQLYDKPGDYDILSIATNGSGCADTVKHTLTVFPLPIVDAGPDKFICAGQSTMLSASGAATYDWQNSSALSCFGCYNPVAKPAATKMFIVTGTDIHGCKAEDSVLIRVKQPFVMSVGVGDTLCFGQSYKLKANGAEKYIWSPATFLNNPAIANPIATPDSSIRYRVIGYDTLGCFADTGFVALKVYPIPQVDILEDKITVKAGSTLQLHSTVSSDVTNMHWSPALGLSCVNCKNPIASPKEDITYTLTVTNGGGCTAKDNVDLLVVCSQGNVYIPNTFSPNNDGVNDIFYPRGKGIYGIKGMRVFSRWGELLYEKTNFQPNDISSGWDGSFKGQKLTPDVYVYIIEVVCDNNQIFTLKGNVTLLK